MLIFCLVYTLHLLRNLSLFFFVISWLTSSQPRRMIKHDCCMTYLLRTIYIKDKITNKASHFFANFTNYSQWPITKLKIPRQLSVSCLHPSVFAELLYFLPWVVSISQMNIPKYCIMPTACAKLTRDLINYINVKHVIIHTLVMVQHGTYVMEKEETYSQS
jgi:hypothetical protein